MYFTVVRSYTHAVVLLLKLMASVRASGLNATLLTRSE
jgi:hypothetical protein